MKKYIASLIIVASFLGLVVFTQPAEAIDVFKNCTSNSVICTETKSGTTKTNSFIQNIVRILLFAIGTISVIMIIIGGIRYSTSNGDPGKITGAKNTILYAIVGLVVALMAYSIVYFVLGYFK